MTNLMNNYVIWDVYYYNPLHVSSNTVLIIRGSNCINPLAPELFFLILAHPVYKMWIIQEPNKLSWNKLHFEEKKKTESIEHV